MGRLEAALESLVVVAALATVPIVVLQELGAERSLVVLADWTVWTIFLTELTVMASKSGAPLTYMRRRWLSVAVVVLSFPLLPVLFHLSRLARLGRLLRLLRLLVVTALGLHALKIVFGRRGMASVACAAILLVFSTAGLLVVLEPENLQGGFWSGVWWAVVTITTVGYGDIVPGTAGGKMLGVVLMLMGIGLVSTLAASISAYFVDQEGGSEIKSLNKRLMRIEAMMVLLVAQQAPTTANHTTSSPAAVEPSPPREPPR